MAAASQISETRMRELLAPFYPEPTGLLLDQLGVYLDLLLRWNGKTNLTAVRDPELIISRHFGESLFTARHLPRRKTLLDLGSGAGFPGLPIQLALPELQVTLAESQNKKASFLREVVRALGLSTEVWPKRIEDMPADKRFDIVTLRAVDNPAHALNLAAKRTATDGFIAHLTTATEPVDTGINIFTVPGADDRVLQIANCSTWNIEQVP